MEGAAARGFTAASRFFCSVVESLPPGRHGERWSDEWRVLDLVAHGNRSNVLVVEYHERPVPPAGPDYASPANVAARARRAAEALGDDPARAVREASDRAVALVAAAPDDAVVGTPFGEQPLARYLQSRTAELVLHGLDLDPAAEPPPEALAECGAFLAFLAVRRGRGVEVVRALSGREDLAPGFTVY